MRKWMDRLADEPWMMEVEDDAALMGMVNKLRLEEGHELVVQVVKPW